MSNNSGNEKIAKIVIDRKACIGAATCIVVSPKAFDLDEDGVAIVKEGALQSGDGELFVAAQSCPTQAILLYDESGKQIFPKK
jgi:ferredoxin